MNISAFLLTNQKEERSTETIFSETVDKRTLFDFLRSIQVTNGDIGDGITPYL